MVTVAKARDAYVKAFLDALPEAFDKEQWRVLAEANFAGLIAVEQLKSGMPVGPARAGEGFVTPADWR